MPDAAPILHVVSPLRHVSPFDINMAIDAGFNHVATYSGLRLEEVTSLTQDMMFSRAPNDAVRTSLFIGGKDASLALDMLEAARKALFPPFVISLFVDPAGSFTTSAAMIALVEKHLRGNRPDGLKGAKVQVFGATGVVGGIAGVIAAQAGGQVTFVSHRDIETVAEKAADFKRRFGVDIAPVSAVDDAAKRRLLPEAEVVLAAGAAGLEVLDEGQLGTAERLVVAADVNAVAPTGLAGVEVDADGTPLPVRGLGIGALTIGRLKYQVQHQLLKQMLTSGEPITVSFGEAFDLARRLVQ